MVARTPSCKTLPAVSRKKDWESVRAGDKLTAVLGSVPAKLEGQLQGAIVREHFAQAVIDEYGEAAAAWILERVQGVYLIKDDSPVKASSTGRAPVYLNIYTTEAMIKADLDNRQEALKRRMRKMDVYFDRLKPHSSTGDMRYRTPFEKRVAELHAALTAAEARAAAAEAVGEGEENPWTDEHIDEVVSQVDDPKLAESIRRAMSASLQ